MSTLDSYDLYCPRCRKMADTANPMFIKYSVRRLQLPIFLCGDCRTIYIDKPIVRHVIKEWQKGGLYEKNITLKQLYREFLGKVERLVDTCFVSRFGYKKTRFLKRP